MSRNKINWHAVYRYIATKYEVLPQFEAYCAEAKLPGLSGVVVALQLALHEIGIRCTDEFVQREARAFFAEQQCCGTAMMPSKALTNLVTDEEGNGSQSGPPRLVPVLKCAKCGRSKTY